MHYFNILYLCFILFQSIFSLNICKFRYITPTYYLPGFITLFDPVLFAKAFFKRFLLKT